MINRDTRARSAEWFQQSTRRNVDDCKRWKGSHGPRGQAEGLRHLVQSTRVDSQDSPLLNKVHTEIIIECVYARTIGVVGCQHVVRLYCVLGIICASVACGRFGQNRRETVKGRRGETASQRPGGGGQGRKLAGRQSSVLVDPKRPSCDAVHEGVGRCSFIDGQIPEACCRYWIGVSRYPLGFRKSSVALSLSIQSQECTARMFDSICSW